MTLQQKVDEIIKTVDTTNSDEISKLVKFAYYYGAEQATKNVLDKHNDIIHEQKKRAAGCRYSNMAKKIIGDNTFIYSDNYSGGFTNTFGNDKI